MSDAQTPRLFTYRLITVNGAGYDFMSPNPLEAMWTIIRGDGYFQMTGQDGKATRRIAYHSIASLEYFDPMAVALAHAPSASLAKA